MTITTTAETLTDQQIDQYRRNGFVNGGLVLDEATIDTLRTEVLRVIDDRDNPDAPQPVSLRNLSQSDDAPIWQIVNIFESSSPFRELIDHQQIANMAAQLSGAQELRVWHDQIQYKPKTLGGRLHWHQDSPLWPTLQPKHEQISAWVALDDADMDNGCMYMVPGSHQWGNQQPFLQEMPHGVAPPDTFEGKLVYTVMCPVKKGHVHFHHSLTWHGSGTNTSSRPRRAVAIHFMSENTTYDASGNHSMKPFVTVADGEKLVGDAFPLVWTNGAKQEVS
jgi:ectoine hydroxylase-related dioxygenase (phytanoyl-CoA dioxygenase family)